MLRRSTAPSASCLSEGHPSHSTVAFRGQPPVTVPGCQSDPKGGRFVPLKRAKPEGAACRGTFKLAGYPWGYRDAGGFRVAWHPGPTPGLSPRLSVDRGALAGPMARWRFSFALQSRPASARSSLSA